jgi:hypothetical protein
MCPFNLNQNPQHIARIFSQYVQTLVMILVWTVIALTSLSLTYLAIRALWAGIKFTLSAIL